MKVKDMIAVTKRLRHDTQGHTHNKISACACKYCKHDRHKGCLAPWKCCEAALGMPNKLHPRFDPFCNPEIDNLSLTPQHIKANGLARETGDRVTFDPSITDGDDLAPNFRVFGPKRDSRIAPAFRRARHQGHLEEDEVTVCTGGACTHLGQEDAAKGGGVWYSGDNDRNYAFQVPGDLWSKESGEITAVLHFLQTESVFAPLVLVSTSALVIDSLMTNLDRIEAAGHIGLADKDLFKAVVATLRGRGAATCL